MKIEHPILDEQTLHQAALPTHPLSQSCGLAEIQIQLVPHLLREKLDVSKQCPTEVSCKMSKENWRSDLNTYNLLGKYNFLLEGFRTGFHQGIPPHSLSGLDFYCPPNHSSALKVRDKIKKNIDKEVAAKRMFGPYTKQLVFEKLGFFRTSPLGSVENGDKLMRPLNNLSYPRSDPVLPSVNSFVNKDDFETTWDNFKVVAKFFWNLEEDCRIGLFGWEGAYRKIPTHPSQWQYLAVLRFKDEVYIDTRIAFG